MMYLFDDADTGSFCKKNNNIHLNCAINQLTKTFCIISTTIQPALIVDFTCCPNTIQNSEHLR